MPEPLEELEPLEEGEACGNLDLPGPQVLRTCEAGLECKCVGACADPNIADAPSTCVKMQPKPVVIPQVRKIGETCGWVFGPGYVGDCEPGLECMCVGSCADQMVADAPSTCVVVETA